MKVSTILNDNYSFINLFTIVITLSEMQIWRGLFLIYQYCFLFFFCISKTINCDIILLLLYWLHLVWSRYLIIYKKIMTFLQHNFIVHNILVYVIRETNILNVYTVSLIRRQQ